MGDDERAIGLLEPADKFDGGFDSLPAYQTGRLKDKKAVFNQPHVLFEVPIVIVDLLGEYLEIHDIRDQGPARPGAPGKFQTRDGVDDHMLNVGLNRGKGRSQIIHGGEAVKPLPLPVEIMVVCYGRYAGLGDKLGQRKSQRDVDRNGQSILDNQNIKLKPIVKLLQCIFELFFDGMNFLGGFPGPLLSCKQRMLYVEDLRVLKKGFRLRIGYLIRCIEFPGHVKYPTPFAFEYIHPFLGFQ